MSSGAHRRAPRGEDPIPKSSLGSGAPDYSRAMTLAAIGDTSYNIVLLLHVLTAIVALSPVFVHPLLRNQMRGGNKTEHQHLVSSMAANVRRLYGPALIVSGLLGFALAGMSDKVHSMTDGWLLAAAIIWVAMNGILHGMITPALKAVGRGQGTPPIERRLERGSALMTLMFVVQLVLMIWQPG